MRNAAIKRSPEKALGLLEELIELFTQSPSLSSIYRRGSQKDIEFDRSADLDLVLVYDGHHYSEVISCFELLLAQNFNLLFPGFNDANASELGGLGFEFLIERENVIHQVDIFLTATERTSKFPRVLSADLVYQRQEPCASPLSSLDELDQFIKRFTSARPTARDFLVEALTRACVVQKRIENGQTFHNYAEAHRMNNAIRNFIRSATDPGFVPRQGWYQIAEHLSKSKNGEAWLAGLNRVISGPAVHNHESLKIAVSTLLAMAEQATPPIYKELKDSINVYLKRSDLL